MSENKKCRLAEVLSVGENERFSVWGGGIYHVANGRLFDENAVCRDDVALMLINFPDRIIRKPKFTDEEMTVLRALYKAGAGTVKREPDGTPIWEYVNDTELMYFLPRNMFPGIKSGETVNLAEMFGEGVS